MAILDEILAAKREEVRALAPDRRRLERDARDAPTPRDFVGVLRAGATMALVAEIKRQSPSKGPLAPDLDVDEMASAYERGGAAALSVLTDRPFFAGSLDDLRGARGATGLPILRKDFTIDTVQLFEARTAGADAVLVVAAAVPDDGLLRELRVVAEDLGMAALVEVDGEGSLERALASGATLVGVTNRDLRTFDEDLTVAERLGPRLPPDATTVAESGIGGPADARRMAEAGFDALLVGEALVRAAQPEAACRALRVPRVAAHR